MSEHSFFVPPESIRGGRVELSGETARQIRSVLRLQPGDTVHLLDNSGYLHVARLVGLSKESVAAEVVERRRPETEPAVELELFQALLKGQKMEMVLQKGTEIGVCRFVPVLSERCVSRPGDGDVGRKLERWEAIVREAAEQSGRAVLPAVEPVEPWQEACARAAGADLALMAWEEERAVGIGQAVREAGLGLLPPSPALPPSEGEGGGHPLPPLWGKGAGGRGEKRPRISLLIGPEGGFSPREARLARDAGLRIVSLGPRILRAETAALVAVTLVLCETGDLGG